jgi:predicted ATP-grasp superfamily ATP-dependent carboligase
MVKGVLIIEGHVQGLSNARSAAELNLPVWVMHNGNCIASSSISCQKFIYCNQYDSEDFIHDLIKLGIDNNLRDWLIIPSNDYAVLNIARNEFKLAPFYTIFSSDFKILEQIIDKSALMALATNCNVPIPETYKTTDNRDFFQNDFSFPVLTRGTIGQDFYKKIGVKALKSKNLEELKINLNKIGDHFDISQTLTQELIETRNGNKSITVSTCCLCLNGIVLNLWVGEKLNEHPLSYGTATLARSVEIKELEEPTRNLIKGLEYTGVCEIEWLYNLKQKRYNLIEINPRTWLWVELAKASGINFIKDIIQLANGKEVVKNKPYETDIYWFNPITYYPFKILAILKNVKSYRPKGKIVNALFKKGDNKPGWTYLWTLFNILKKR